MNGSSGRYYERYWSDEGHQPSGEIYADLVTLLAPFAKPGAQILDVGCGDGSVAGHWLTSRGCTYRGVDVSATAIRMARAAGLEADVIDDASELPPSSKSVDLVLCIEVLEHLFDPYAAAEEMLRVLKPGGVLVATVPNTMYWRRRCEFLSGRWNPVGDDLSVTHPWRDPHIRFFSAKTVSAMLRQAGFIGVEVTGHAGAFVRDIPKIGLRLYRGKSPTYEALERWRPSIFSLRLGVTAQRPSS